MEKKPLTFEIEPEVVNMLERLSYEMTSRERVVAYIIETHADDTTPNILNSTVFKAYHAQLDESVAAFELARKKLEESFPERGIPMGNWVLDYATRTLSVVPYDQNLQHTCSCKHHRDEPTDTLVLKDHIPMQDGARISEQ